jgi:hypothetical protein
LDPILGVACSSNAATGVVETCEGDLFVAARRVDGAELGRLQVIGKIPIRRRTFSTPCTPRSSPTSLANPPHSQSQSYQEPHPRTSSSSQDIKEVRHLSRQWQNRGISTPCRVVCHNQRRHVQLLNFKIASLPFTDLF